MTARFGERRKAAFLEALAACGNQTLAAERTRVSRSWVVKRRREDGGFDAAVKEACRDASTRLSTGSARHARGGSNKPPKGWGHLDGVELVVRGTGGSGGGKRVQIARARVHQWDARTEDRFLEVLQATCNAGAAYRAAGMSKASAYAHRKRWPGFAARWQAAVEQAYDRLEWSLIAEAGNLFSREGLPPEIPIREMNAGHAIHLLHMHKKEARGIGKAPGVGWRPPPTLDELRPGILRKLAAFEGARRVPEAVKQGDRAERARRRRGGRGCEKGEPRTVTE